VLAKALADYRAGMLLSAVEGLKRFAPKPEGGSHDVTGFALLAMTQHRLGQVKEAREALANAQAILAKKMPDPAKGQPFGDDWHEWAHSRTLCREAEQLLTKELDGKKPE